jgi:MYXO-CTERM domain-containing protein
MKSIRSLAFRFGLASAVAAGATLLAGAAHADSTPSPSGKCETTLQCSGGTASLRAQGRGPFVTSVSTGWLPACATPDAKGHCAGDQDLQFRADISLNAPDDTSKMLYDVDMRKGAIVDVTWPDKDALTLKLAGGAVTDGNFVIQHTLAPNAGIYVGKIGPFTLNQEFNYDATQLVTSAPGGHWNYLGLGSNTFLPWALGGGATVDVKGPDLANSMLFSTPLENLPGLSGILTGTLGMSATTSPTFTYKTTKVQFTSVASPITPAAPSQKIKYQNADSIDLFANVEGELAFKGTMEVLPVVTITSIYTLTGLNIQIPISVGAKTDYDSGTTPLVITFPGTKVHVPLPNVFVPVEDVDFGSIKTGTQAEKSVTVNNTGELGAILAIESSDPAFVVEAPQAQMTPKSQSDLKVRFQPTKDGDATATITVTSNDPDAPVQVFNVKGNATPVPAAVTPPVSSATEPPAPTAQPGANSGCGCRVTAPTMSSEAGMAFLGLAALAFVRRRRAKK